ncbi:MAG: glycosyltransferase [Planctomycetota bacterium]
MNGSARRHLIWVNHTFRRTDGQGRVNLEVVSRLAGRYDRLTLIGADVPAELAATEGVAFVETLPRSLPTTPLRHLSFAGRAGRAVRRARASAKSAGARCVIVANGAMLTGPVDVNASHFVHGSWKANPAHPRHGGGARGMYQGFVTRWNALWERRAYRQAGRVIAVSPQVANDVIDHCGVAPQRVCVIESGVDLDTFTPWTPDQGSPRQGHEWEAARDKLVLGFCGDLQTNRKNLDLLLAALGRVDGVHAFVLGGEAGSRYPGLVNSLGLADKVAFLGHRPDVAKWFAQVDVVVYPSHYEPWGLVVPEALASGAAVITVPQVGASTLVRDGENGYVLSGTNDVDGLAATLRRLAESPGLVNQLRHAAPFSVSELTWSRTADAYADVIDRAFDAAPDYP